MFCMRAALIFSHALSMTNQVSLRKLLISPNYFYLFFIPFISRRFEQQAFEQQADEFAYKDCNKPEGFIELVAPGAEQERIQRDLQLKADKQDQEETSKLPLATRIKETTIAIIEDIPAMMDEGLYWLLTNKMTDTHTSYETQLKAVQEYLVKS